MKNKIFVLWLCLALVGCMQSKEHIVLKDDGSGTLERHLLIPAGTIHLLDATLGGFVKMMSKSFGKEAQEKIPKSVVDEMFGNKNGLLKKAKASGVNIIFNRFDSKKDENGLTVDYELKFDNITKLLASGIVTTKIDIVPGPGAKWTCLLKADPKKAEESKGKLDQFDSFKQSEAFTSMDPFMQAGILKAINNLEIEFLISMPYQIDDAYGAFEKVNETTARLAFSGSFLEDPALIEKLYGIMGADSKVVWNTANPQEIKEPQKETLHIKESHPLAQPPAPVVVPEEEPVVVQEEPVVIEQDAIAIEDIESDVQVIDVGPGQQKIISQVQIVDVTPKEDTPLEQQAPAEGTIKIYLKNGEIIEGLLMEKTDDYFKINFDDIPLTYYSDQIDRVE